MEAAIHSSRSPRLATIQRCIAAEIRSTATVSADGASIARIDTDHRCSQKGGLQVANRLLEARESVIPEEIDDVLGVEAGPGPEYCQLIDDRSSQLAKHLDSTGLLQQMTVVRHRALRRRYIVPSLPGVLSLFDRSYNIILDLLLDSTLIQHRRKTLQHVLQK